MLPEDEGKARKQQYIELFFLSLAFNRYPSLSFSPFLPPVVPGCAERQGLLENIFHKTILKVETAQVRELTCLVYTRMCVHLFINRP